MLWISRCMIWKTFFVYLRFLYLYERLLNNELQNAVVQLHESWEKWYSGSDLSEVEINV